ncbi:MAG: N-6 DNA methylase [Chitinophagaceae bacterium]|nr:N-6 DNA methylase [Chitinophagaceae bacterium]
MLDTPTKKRIDDCRDILVGKLPDPKAQIEQITIALIYKFMDDMDKEAVELGGHAKFFSDYKIPDPEFPKDRNKDKTIEFSKYARDQLMHPKVTAAEMLTLYSEAIEGMAKNPNIPQLFRDIFNNAYLPYRDPETLKLFLKTIGEFDYNHSENLGDAFEYLLSVMGSQGDAGQFRTPRHIIDFLVAIVDPDKTDTILDPACGTAGFLISAYKHILLKYSKDNKVQTQDSTPLPNNGKDVQTRYSASPQYNIYTYNRLEEKPFNNLGDQLTPDDRKKLIQNFTGYDISPDMVRLSLVNLYLHGFSTPNIHEYDTLSSEERWNDTFDVILANPPFMSPKGGIRPHKRFTISSNRSEVLFVDYIAEHLNPNGKAGIIVPEGIIFQSGRAYKDLRKMLVENYLYAVVSLPAGVFNPYSGVKTSILLMDRKVAKQKEEILFIKIDKDGYNLGAQRTPIKGEQLSEAIALLSSFRHSELVSESPIAHLVPKAEIAKNGDYNLSGERYKVIIQRSSKFPLVPIGEVCTLINGRAFKPSDWESEEMGGLPIIRIQNLNNKDSVFNFYSGEVDKRYIVEPNDLLFSWSGSRGTSFGAHIWYGDRAILNQHIFNVYFDANKAIKRYLYYALNQAVEEVEQNLHGGVGLVHITKGNLEKIQIPLPPLSIQEEIVAEIEAYQKIIDGAKAVVENYKPHIDIDPDWEMVELGEVAKFSQGTQVDVVLQSKDYTEGYEKFLRIENYTQNSSDFRYIPKSLGKGKYVDKNDIVVVRYGASAGFVGRGFNGILANNLFKVEPSNQLQKDFLYHFLNSELIQKQFKRITAGGAMPALSFKTVSALSVAIPPIEIQHQIVSQIEKEQELVNANKQLIEIFEQKIKDRIAKVWGE